MMINRKKFITLLSGLTLLLPKTFAKKDKIEIEFIRHATFKLNIGGLTFLVDPMLSGKHEMDPVGNAQSTERIPMVSLPFPETSIKENLENIGGVIVTHTHRDHWDAKAQSLLNKELSVICQPPDTEKLKQQGFVNLLAVTDKITFKGMTIYRVGGQHGTGDIGAKMGPVSGFVIEHEKKKIYIAGDTIWCDEVEHTIQTHEPDLIIVNAGAAQFNQGDPITMTSKDVIRTITARPSATVIAVHMETINHCLLTRKQLRKDLEEANFSKHILIPADGETIHVT